MVKLVAIYKKPEDVAAFDKHYAEVHTPLALRMPGLVKAEIARVTGGPMGESPLHMIAELYFKDMASLGAAMQSAEGKAAAKDLMGFAGKYVQMHFAEVKA